MLDSSLTMSGGLKDLFQAAAPIVPAVITNSELSTNQKAWQAVIDRSLTAWLRDPNLLEDEDIVPPSGEVIQWACKLAALLRDKGTAAPTRIVPTGDGGIAFERVSPRYFESIEIQSDGSVEIAGFQDSQLVSRERINVPFAHLG